MQKTLVIIAAALTIACLPGCKNGENVSRSEVALPADFDIIVGQTGGFAGRMTGFAVNADGVVMEWEGKHAKENIRRESAPDPTRALTIWRDATEAGILQMSEQAAGEATWFVALTAGGESRRVSWSSWPSDPEDMTEAQRFYNRCVELAKSTLDS